MSASEYSNHAKNENNSLLTRALTRRRTGFSPDVLVPDEIRDEDHTSLAKSVVHDTKNVIRNSLISGSISGMASTIALYPMDFIRTNLQTSAVFNTRSTGVTPVAGPLQVLRQTIQSGGITALYTGITLPLMAQAVYKGTVFTVNNILERVILDYKQQQQQQQKVVDVKLSTADRLLCGFVAGAANGAMFVTPVEFVRNQLIAEQAKLSQVSKKGGTSTAAKPSTSWSMIRQSIQLHGLRTMWRGVGITMLRDGLGVASFFTTLGITQHYLIKIYHPDDGTNNINTESPLMIRIVSGGLGGLAYWVVSLPLDTIKTWIQSSDPSVRVSPMKDIQNLFRQQGLLAVVGRLTRGWQVAYSRGIPSSAITIGVYSYTYRALEQYDVSTDL